MDVQVEFCKIAFRSPVLIKETEAFWELFSNSGFDLLNGYFTNYYGQTLFLDGILMDIMVDNGEIWWKFSVSVMVYIY